MANPRNLHFPALSVRTILITGAILLFSGGCLKVCVPYVLEQRVIAEIEKLGGSAQTMLIRPTWISDALNDDYLIFLERVVRVDLDGTSVRDEDLQQLHALKHLRNLSLSKTQISNTGLLYLSGLTSLQGLNLEFTKISNAGLHHLGELPNLKILRLDNTLISDAGLNRLKDSTCLGLISLRSTQVSQAGLASYEQTASLWDKPYYSPDTTSPATLNNSVGSPSPLLNMMWQPPPSSTPAPLN